MYNEKHSMMVVHAAPKAQPGGVQGALSKPAYHADATPLPVNKPPMPKAAKLSMRKIASLPNIIFFLS